MNHGDAIVEACRRWCKPRSHRRPVVRIQDDMHQVGYDDSEFIYILGQHKDGYAQAFAAYDAKDKK